MMMMRRLAWGLLGLSPVFSMANPFTPYLTRQAPAIVRDLGTEVKGDVSLHKVVFLSRKVDTPDGQIPNEVYATIARPLKPGTYPGILVLHGGKGFAEEELVSDWARRGFVAVSADLPNVADPQKVPNSAGYWKSQPYGTGRFTATPNALHAGTFDTALAAVQTLYLLRAQPDVDTAKIGVTGTSWGGWSTIMVAGLAGKDVTAAFAIYGSGHFDKGTTFQDELRKTPTGAEWLKVLDAGNYTGGITADYVQAAAANDSFFFMPAVMATLHDVKSHKNLVLAPNADHWMAVLGGSEKTKAGIPHSNGWMYMQVTYFEYVLKGIGSPLPEVYGENLSAGSAGMQTVNFFVRGAIGAVKAHVYYSAYDPVWKARKWMDANAQAKAEGYVAEIPKDTQWFAEISDSRPTTVSSTIHPLVDLQSK
jgi:dienelactone hydrolase